MWKVHNIFYILPEKQNTTKKGQINKKILKLDNSNNNSKEYKVEEFGTVWSI